MNQNQINTLADRLIAAYDNVQTLDPITSSFPECDVSAAYEILHEINRRREANGWKRVGRKIGFTNRTIWARYGVGRPMWAPCYSCTVHQAPDGRAEIALRPSKGAGDSIRTTQQMKCSEPGQRAWLA